MGRPARPAAGWPALTRRGAPWIGATGVVRRRSSGVGEAARLPGDAQQKSSLAPFLPGPFSPFSPLFSAFLPLFSPTKSSPSEILRMNLGKVC
jgi:hypothetical protein